jgi:hypothetical protein
MRSVSTSNIDASRTSAPTMTAAIRTQAVPSKNDSAIHEDDATHVSVRLVTAVLATVDFEPVVRVLTRHESGAALEYLPACEFGTSGEMSLDLTLRSHVCTSTGLTLGYVNQLATFTNPTAGDPGEGHVPGPKLTIGYLALTHLPSTPCISGKTGKSKPGWVSCYAYLPWEDWRQGRPDVITTTILPRLAAWAEAGAAVSPETSDQRQKQIQICFGSAHTWDDERVLERYELLMSAGLLHGPAALNGERSGTHPELGRPLAGDHRMIVAAALGRLRSKLRYRPVVFELMAKDFTLFELQRTVEGIIGPHLHKQNFRRLVESMGLVEPTGEIKNHTGGRPAKLFRFRPGVVLEQAAPGMRVRAGHV